MLERVLLNLAVGLTGGENASASTYGLWPSVFQVPVELHIGMLSISLITGLAYGGFVSYRCWTEGNILLSYIRNLMIAFVCRTFFAILLDGIVVLGTVYDVKGGNTLSAFETISLNLVYAYWLLLTMYLYARMQRNFNNEPGMKHYQIGVPVVAVFFSLVWIFSMEGERGLSIWWLTNFLEPITQWINASLRLLYLFVQLGLLVDIGISSMKASYDNDTISLLRKVSILMGVLVFLFWLEFGLSVGRPPRTVKPEDMQPYLFFYFFIDGLLCGLVCPIFYFFDKWVVELLVKISPILSTVDSTEQTTTEREISFNRTTSKSLQTLDSVFVTRESGRQELTKDVVYSSVVQPEKLKKTLDLYQRFNLIPSQEVVTIEGEQFYDCRSEDYHKGRVPIEGLDTRTPKKNAFYTSKYLILEPKEHRRKSEESKSDKYRKSPSSSISSISPVEVVEKWLKRNSNEEKRPQASIRKSKQKQAEKDDSLGDRKQELSIEEKQTEGVEELNLKLRVLEEPKPEETTEPKMMGELSQNEEKKPEDAKEPKMMNELDRNQEKKPEEAKEPEMMNEPNQVDEKKPEPKARTILPQVEPPAPIEEPQEDTPLTPNITKRKIIPNLTDSESEFEVEKCSIRSSMSSFSLDKYYENQSQFMSKLHSTS